MLCGSGFFNETLFASCIGLVDLMNIQLTGLVIKKLKFYNGEEIT